MPKVTKTLDQIKNIFDYKKEHRNREKNTKPADLKDKYPLKIDSKTVVFLTKDQYFQKTGTMPKKQNK